MPINHQQAIFKWCRHNIDGEPQRGRYRHAAFWFRDRVLYQHEKPIGRLLKHRDEWMLLAHLDSWCYAYKPDAGGKETLLKSLRVDNIGVHTEFAGDMIPEGPKLHTFMRKQFVMKCNDYLDRLRNLSGASMEAQWAFMGRASMISVLAMVDENYRVYAGFYGLDWPEMRGRDMGNAIVEKRLAAYNEPATKERRERNAERRAARKAALKALELED